jgi:hypothetical protein
LFSGRKNEIEPAQVTEEPIVNDLAQINKTCELKNEMFKTSTPDIRVTRNSVPEKHFA